MGYTSTCIFIFLIKGGVLLGRCILVALALFASVIATVSASILPLNGHTALELAYSYKIVTLPAMYVYITLPMLYILLCYWVYAQWKNRRTAHALTLLQAILFAASAIILIVWTDLWHYEQHTWAFIAVAIATICLFVLHLTYKATDNRLSGRLPISITLAWVSFLALLNFSFIFVYNGLPDFGLSTQLWTVIFLTCGMAFALAIRFHRYDPAFPIIYIWFFIGIAVANGFNELLVTTAALFLSGVLVVGILFIRKRLPNEKEDV